jgi:tetratricopeptide (TPR) repeat protein
MRAMKARLAMALLAALTASSLAAAQDAADAPGTPPYFVKVQAGIRQVLGRDLDGAVGTFREAVQLDPRRPDAHYHLGVVRRMQGEHSEAIDSFETAARMAKEDAAWRVRALVAIAWTLEQVAAVRPEVGADARPEAPRINEPQLARARDAWQRVRQLATEATGEPIVGTAVSVAVERQRVIDEVIATEGRTVDVRKRIAAREQEKAEEEAKAAAKKGARR